jgi:hypothetical protein
VPPYRQYFRQFYMSNCDCYHCAHQQHGKSCTVFTFHKLTVMEPPPCPRRTVTSHHSKMPVSLASLQETKHYRAVVASSDIQRSCFMKIGQRVQKLKRVTHFRQGSDLGGQSHRNVELASVKPGGNVLKNLGG